MADTGATSPGTMASDNAVGTLTWANPDNAKASDNVYAVSLHSGSGTVQSHYLKATNFGFTIPAGATINGIVVQIEEKGAWAVGSVYDNAVKIVKADASVGGENKASATIWNTIEETRTYGANNDLWSESWSHTDINDADFGVVLTVNQTRTPIGGGCYASVDHIQITVYYTEGEPPAGTNIKINIGDVWKDVAEIKINIGDVWKPVTSAVVNVGDVWKTIF